MSPVSTPIAGMSLGEAKRSALMLAVEMRRLMTELETMGLEQMDQAEIDRIYHDFTVRDGNFRLLELRIAELEAAEALE